MSGCDREAQLQASWDWTKDKSLMILVFMTRYIIFQVSQATYPNPDLYSLSHDNQVTGYMYLKSVIILKHLRKNYASMLVVWKDSKIRTKALRRMKTDLHCI
jgi:hypothetical protein